jgi:UDP-glucose 4-epimerase
MKVAIIGSTGFIGSSLINKLESSDYDILGIDSSKSVCDIKYDFIHASVSDLDSFPFVSLDGSDCIVYLASSSNPIASKSVFHAEIIENNLAFVNFMERLVAYKFLRFIYISSGGAIYSQHNLPPYNERSKLKPNSPYGISKISNEFYLELFARDYNFQFSILRPSNAYGPGQNYRNGLGVIPNFVKSIYSDRNITLFGKNVIRDFVYIDDLVNAIVKCINSSSSGVFNVGSGEPTSIGFLVNLIEDVVGKEFIISNLPIRKTDLQGYYLDISRANTILDWRPSTNIKDGIINYIKWYKKTFQPIN